MPSGAILFAILISLTASRTSQAADLAETEVLFELRQHFEPSHVYFHPAAEELTLARRNGKIVSNAIVYSSLRWGEGAVRSQVDAWLDPRGHVHTVSALKRQVAYLEDYQHWIYSHGTARSSHEGCWLRRGRGKALLVPNIWPTGILDRQTLSLPAYLLELRFDDLARSLERASTLPKERISFRYLRSRVEKARTAIDRLWDELAAIRLGRPAPVRDAQVVRSLGGALSGIEGVDIPFPYTPTKLGERPTDFPQWRTLKSPEAAVEESADPLSLSASVAERLRDAERIATEAIVGAERAQEELFPDFAVALRSQADLSACW